MAENPCGESVLGCSPWGREESDMTERLHFHFSLSCIGEGNGNPLQCSCLENPRDGGAWWAAVYGVAESDTSHLVSVQETLSLMFFIRARRDKTPLRWCSYGCWATAGTSAICSSKVISLQGLQVCLCRSIHTRTLKIHLMFLLQSQVPWGKGYVKTRGSSTYF